MFIFNDLDSRTSSKFGLPSINVTMPARVRGKGLWNRRYEIHEKNGLGGASC